MQKFRPKNNRQKVSANTVLREQKGVCQFIRLKIYSYLSYNQRSVRGGYKERTGLQIENKFFYMEGDAIFSVSLNGKHETYIMDIYDIIPKNTHQKLLEKREQYLQAKKLSPPNHNKK